MLLEPTDALSYEENREFVRLAEKGRSVLEGVKRYCGRRRC
jgi:hypothetical protein